MTSSVFDGIAARNVGYAKVVLHRRSALGDDGCYVAVHLQPAEETRAAVAREYVPDVDRASPDIAEQMRLLISLAASTITPATRSSGSAASADEPSRRGHGRLDVVTNGPNGGHDA